MKRILLLLIFTGCLASEAPIQEPHTHIITDLEAFAQAWAQAAVTELCPEELELLGTFLYYDVASSQYELLLRNALLDLQRGSQILSFKIINQEAGDQTATFCTQLSTVLNVIEKELSPSRNYYLSVWQLCNKEIEQCPHEKLVIAIEQLRLLGQRALNNWSKENKEEIEKILEKNSHNLDEAMQKMKLCKNALDELVDGTFPLSNQTEFIEIQTVHNALGISHVLYEVLFRASLATDEILGTSFGLISLNTIIFGTLYRALHEALENKNLMPMHLVINEQGLIPAESRTIVLPKFTFNTKNQE